MENVFIDMLDDYCWQLILERLRDNKYDLSSASIACKRFYLIANRAKTSLIVSDLTVHLLPSYLRKLPNLKSLEFCIKKSYTDPYLITHILKSDLQHLEALKFRNRSFSREFLGEGFRKLNIKMKGLKRLDLCDIDYLYDDDLMVLKDLFPCLEELDIGFKRENYMLTDGGIKALASKLYCLRKIALRGCHDITDKSLMSLSSNCVELMDVTIEDCYCVTENGIGFLMRYSPKLTSLCLSCMYDFWQEKSRFTFKKSISYANNLEHLEFDNMRIPNGVLYAIAKSSPPLKRLYFKRRWAGPNLMLELTMLVSVCPFLKEFSSPVNLITDKFVLDISKDLRCLTHIDLSMNKLGSATFFTLTKNFPLLESIVMSNTHVGACEDIDEDLQQNYKVKHLDLSYCSLINDRSLVRFALVCPNLESLIIHRCPKITNTGVVDCLRVCPELKHLDISELGVSNFMGHSNGESKLKLKLISATETHINDEDLKIIGERCLDLEKLDIRGCQDVTDLGVKELMSKCEKLRHLNLMGCGNVSIDLLDWIMTLRPSLKRIVPPCDFDPTEEQRNFFLRKGYLVF